jgi:acetyl-CoA C-acetyltransferase
MGVTAENVAERYGITRAMQDQLAYESQQRAARAIAGGRFTSQIVPVEIKTRKGTVRFETALVTMCIGGGQGIAAIFERG